MNIGLKPALILGSSFHKHVFGDVNCAHTRRVLWDWHALLDATAEQMKVACPSRGQEPVIRLETLIIRAQTEGFRGRNGDWIAPTELAANQVEEKAKGFVADILKQSSGKYPESWRAKIPLSRAWRCVISLNFDHAWLPGLKPSRAHHCIEILKVE